MFLIRKTPEHIVPASSSPPEAVAVAVVAGAAPCAEAVAAVGEAAPCAEAAAAAEEDVAEDAVEAAVSGLQVSASARRRSPAGFTKSS
jgi:hypothetical protein